MTTQPIASSRPAPSAPGPARHRRIRTAAAITATAALIATGSYLAATTSPDVVPPTPADGIDTDVNPSAQTLRDMHQSVAGQYASRPSASAVVNPSAQVRRELRQSTAGQYGSQAAPDATVHPSAQVRRESIAGQYDPAG